MAFPQQGARNPDEVGEIILTIVDRPGEPLSYQINYTLLDAADTGMVRQSLDMEDHATPGLINGFRGQMTALRAQLKNDAIP